MESTVRGRFRTAKIKDRCNLNYNFFPFHMNSAEEVDVDKIISKLL